MYGQGIEVYCAPTADDRDTWVPSMQHIALEGRCFVLSACQVMRRSDYPEDYDSAIDAAPDDLMMRGGSAVITPTGEILAGPVFGEERLLYADIDERELVRQSLDFDVAGHYSRADIFSLEVDTCPKRAVQHGASNGD